MNSESILAKLATELTHSERQEVLSRILRNTENSIKPIEYEVKGDAPKDTASETANLPFFQRFFLWVEKLLNWKKMDETVKNYLLKVLARKLFMKKGLLTRDMIYLTKKLRGLIEEIYEISKFFNIPISLATQNNASFFAFLGRITINDHYEALVSTLDPEKIVEAIDSTEENRVKVEMDQKLDQLMASMSPEQRDLMDKNVLLFSLLRKFCQFNFSHFLHTISFSLSGKLCKLTSVSDYLSDLADLLYGFQVSKNSSLFETLYLFEFSVDERLEDVKQNDLRKWVQAAYESFGRLSVLVDQLCLRDLTACSLNSYFYYPKTFTSSDSWGASYKHFWEIYKRQRLQEFFKNQNFLMRLEECIKLFKLTEFPWATQYGVNWKKTIGDLPKYAASLAFCLHTSSLINIKMSYPLKIVLKEGDFYKKQNQEELSNAYGKFLKILSGIKLLEEKTTEFLSKKALFHAQVEDGAMDFNFLMNDSPSSVKFSGGELEGLEVLELAHEDEFGISQEDGNKDQDLPPRSDEADGGEAVEPSDTDELDDMDEESFLVYFKKEKLVKASDFYFVAEKILVDYRAALLSLKSVLNGILYGEVGGNYDTLSNLAYLGGGRGQLFIENLKIYSGILEKYWVLYEKLNGDERSF